MSDTAAREHDADPATPDELFAHGLLSLVHADAASSERRIARALRAIEREDRPLAFFTRFRSLAAAAAVLIVGLTAAVFMYSTEQSAQAIVRASLRAVHAAGERRFQAHRQRVEGGPPILAAIIDARDSLVLFRFFAPRRQVERYAGRDAEGSWGLDADGRIDRTGDPFAMLPGWTGRGDGSFFTDAPEAVEAELERSYRLERLAPEPHPDRPGVACHRIAAIKTRARAGLYAGRIDLWIDPESQLPERIEFSDFPSGENRTAGRPPPPIRVIIDRVDADPFPDDWFNAARWGKP